MDTNPNSLSGVLIMDKPSGVTSFDVVKKIKKILGIQKAGHTGTLDPMATGVLPICIGKSTKLSGYFMNDKKTYSGMFYLGACTDTYDIEGKIIAEEPIPPHVDLDFLRKCAKSFTGEILQKPPAFSATKHKGVPLYKLARKGIFVDKEPKKITIYNFDILSYNIPFIEFKIECSKGTYVRALAHDFGKALGTCAYLYSLRREQNGPFNAKNAIKLDYFEEISQEERYQYIIPHETVLKILGVN